MPALLLFGLLAWVPLGAAVSATISSVPRWCLVGILGVETSSYYVSATATQIVYVNRKIGKSQERGPFQMTPEAFAETALPGECFLDLVRTPEFAETLTRRRLVYLYNHLKTWEAAVRAYNVGLRGARLGRGKDYLAEVREWASEHSVAMATGVVP